MEETKGNDGMRENGKNCIKSQDSDVSFLKMRAERKRASGLGSGNLLLLCLSGHLHIMASVFHSHFPLCYGTQHYVALKTICYFICKHI